MKKGTKVLGTLVLALAVLSPYLAIASWFYSLGVGPLPLEGGLSRDLVFPLIIFSLLGSIMVNKRRRLESAQSSPNTN